MGKIIVKIKTKCFLKASFGHFVETGINRKAV